MPAYRALTGIDFDAVGSAAAVRVEPGETLPALSDRQAAGLLLIGAIEPLPEDAAPVEDEAPAPKKGRR